MPQICKSAEWFLLLPAGLGPAQGVCLREQVCAKAWFLEEFLSVGGQLLGLLCFCRLTPLALSTLALHPLLA